MKTRNEESVRVKKGFTLVEVLIAVTLFTLIMGGTISTYLMCQRVWNSTSLKIQTAQTANLAMARMVYGIETNQGLRSAAALAIDTTCTGVYQPWVPPTNYPPAANATNHWVVTSWGGADGSWRMTISNQNGRITWIDYNINASNMVFWPNTLDSLSRKLIANYVTSATAVSTNNGVFIKLSIVKHKGNFLASNEVSTFVKTRN